MTSSTVPEFFRRLWRLPEAPQQRGRKSTLDVEAVVGTAIRLADDGGLEAAPLPAVAEELKVTAMPLHRHIAPTREPLRRTMDAGSPPPASVAPLTGWRGGPRHWAHDLCALSQDRPWLPR